MNNNELNKINESSTEKSLGKEVGEKLRQEREKRNLKLREVGRILDIDYSYLGRIERGSLPSASKLRQLADFYNIPMASLFGEEIDTPKELKDVGVEWISFSKDMKEQGMDVEELRKIANTIIDIKNNLKDDK